MKFFKISLLCCILGGLSAMATNAAENPIETHLQSNPASENYRILTSQGKVNPTWKTAIGKKSCNYLDSAAALTDSHLGLVLSEGKEGKDSLRAARSIDRLSVATQLLRKGKATQKATVATNQQYLNFTYMKGINLAARLGAIEDLQSVFGLVSQELGIDDEHHLKLTLLTVNFYAEAVGLNNTFDLLKTLTTETAVVDSLATLLGKDTYKAYINDVLRHNTEQYQQKARELYSDAKQRFFEISDDGTMLSAPRALFLSGHSVFRVNEDSEDEVKAEDGVARKNPVVESIKAAGVKSGKNLSDKRVVEALRFNFFINAPEQANSIEQWQTVVAIYAIISEADTFSKDTFEKAMEAIPAPPKKHKGKKKKQDRSIQKLIQYTDYSFLNEKEIKFQHQGMTEVD